MIKYESGLKFLIIIAIAIIVLPWLWWFAGAVIRAVKKKEKQSSHFRTALLFLVIGVFFMRFAVSLFVLKSGAESKGELFQPFPVLNWFEIIFESLFDSMQLISMNSEFSNYVFTVKEMLEALGCSGILLTVTKSFITFLTAIAPAAGGMFVLDVIAGFVPNLRLGIEMLRPFRRKYIFSELNENSLVLARDILKKKGVRRPAIIFTDAYFDDESERSSELFIAAKKMGAICVSDDIIHVKIRCWVRKKTIILIDENEVNNVSAFAELCSEKRNGKILSRFSSFNTQIYVFYQDDSYALTEKKAYDFLYACAEKKYVSDNVEEKNDRKAETLRHMPVVNRIRCYQNLVYGLLRTVPLFTAINGKGDLNVSIIGAGDIGTEMFKSSYWCGQMLDVKLSLNVFSIEKKEEFEKKINGISPEILQSGEKNNPVLRIYPNPDEQNAFTENEKKFGRKNSVFDPNAPAAENYFDEFSEPYFTFRYRCTDIKAGSARDIVCEGKNGDDLALADSDYIFVAIGSDEENIRVAEKLYKDIKADQIKNGKIRDTVIVYVVYNSVLCRSLNYKTSNKVDNIEMHAVGSLEEVFSYENVFMEKTAELAGDYHKHYISLARMKNEVFAQRDESFKRESKPYEANSNIARTVHLKYRMYSAFLCKDIIQKDYTPEKVTEDYRRLLEENPDVVLRLRWLEHRRWNSYIRSQGFKKVGWNKDVELQIHRCLVECKDDALEKNERKDLLDLASYYASPNKKIDYKVYDSPMNEDSGDAASWDKIVKQLEFWK